MIRSVLLARVLEQYGFSAKTKMQVPEIVWRGSEACVKAYLRALFQCDGTVNMQWPQHDELLGATCVEPSFASEGRADPAGELRRLLFRVSKRRDSRRAIDAGRQGRNEGICHARPTMS